MLFEGPFGRLGAGLWGLLWGSFFNVLIIRIPSEESVVRPGSHCRACKARLFWYDNIPVVSYLILRGRCRHCGAQFSIRYMVVEAMVGGLALLIHHQFVVHGVGALGLRMAQFVILSLFCGVLVALAIIDLDTQLIPDLVTYPSIPICILLSLFMRHPYWWDGLVGGISGYLIIRIIADCYHLITGRFGLGYGDAKLLSMVGGLLGWQVLLPTILLASIQGSIIGIGLLLLQQKKSFSSESGDHESSSALAPESGESHEPSPTPEESSYTSTEDKKTPLRLMRIPFGPYISMATIEVLLLRGVLKDWLPHMFFYL